MSYLYLYLSTPYLTWLFFLAIMNLSRAKRAGKLTRTALVLGYPLLAIGYALDIFLNLFVFSLITLDLPRELLTTTHLKRLVRGGLGWRCKVAFWFCHNLLDTFDPSGKHC